jgi:hypothetical protein
MLAENLIWVQSLLIGIFVTIIGFFLRGLIQNLKELGKAITDLRYIVGIESIKYKNFESNYKELKDSVNADLKNISSRISCNEKVIESHTNDILLIKHTLKDRK